MSIIIVDDSVTNLAVLKCLSAAAGRPDAQSYSNAVTALDALSRGPADVVVVDYSMPDLDGITFIERLRAMPHHAETPVIMVTHSADREVRVRALDAGATDFLNKPVDPAEFKARIRNLLRLTEARLAASA